MLGVQHMIQNLYFCSCHLKKMSPAHVSQSVSDVPAANSEQNEAARGKEFPETG